MYLAIIFLGANSKRNTDSRKMLQCSLCKIKSFVKTTYVPDTKDRLTVPVLPNRRTPLKQCTASSTASLSFSIAIN